MQICNSHYPLMRGLTVWSVIAMQRKINKTVHLNIPVISFLLVQEYTIKIVVSLFPSTHLTLNIAKLIIWRKRCFIGDQKWTAIFIIASPPHFIQLFNMLFALLLYCIFQSQLCSLNTECHGSWADFVSLSPLSPAIIYIALSGCIICNTVLKS